MKRTLAVLILAVAALAAAAPAPAARTGMEGRRRGQEHAARDGGNRGRERGRPHRSFAQDPLAPGSAIGSTSAASLSRTGRSARRRSCAGRAGTVRIKGILTKIARDSIELVVAKTGFVTLALPASSCRPGSGSSTPSEVHVAVGSDGKLTLLTLDRGVATRPHPRRRRGRGRRGRGPRDDLGALRHGDQRHDTWRLDRDVRAWQAADRLAVGNVVELECVSSGVAKTLVLNRIEHEDERGR